MTKCDIKPLSPTMNPELKQKWLQALRGGSYPQGTEALHQGQSFCCLGVLCDIGQPLSWTAHEYREHAYYHPWADLDSELINQEILQELKLTDALQRRLADMNDQGKSFAEIAEVIEAEA